MLNRKLNNIIVFEFIGALVVLALAFSFNQTQNEVISTTQANNTQEKLVESTENNAELNTVVKPTTTEDNSSEIIVEPTVTAQANDDSIAPTPEDKQPAQEEDEQKDKSVALCFEVSKKTFNVQLITTEDVEKFVAKNYPEHQLESITKSEGVIESEKEQVWEIILLDENEEKSTVHFSQDSFLLTVVQCEVEENSLE